MCGRYSLLDIEESTKRFKVTNDIPLFEPRYNIAPSVAIPIVQAHSPNKVHLKRWGYHPRWAKTDSMLLINAKSETLSDKSTWKKAFRENRCIIPANGFFEWQRSASKTPYYFQRKDKQLFGFAGLLVGNDENQGVVIMTSSPNPLMSPIHRRQPVILKPEFEDDWLNLDTAEAEELEAILQEQVTEKDMEKYEVTKEVNKATNQGSHLIEPAVKQGTLL